VIYTHTHVYMAGGTGGCPNQEIFGQCQGMYVLNRWQLATPCRAAPSDSLLGLELESGSLVYIGR
jgi:hypothetical protein